MQTKAHPFLSFVIKETRHILRDRRTMLILFGMPIVLMLLFGFAITTDIKNVRTVIVTSEMNPQTQHAVDRLSQSEYFTISATVATPQEAERLIRYQKADIAIVFSAMVLLMPVVMLSGMLFPVESMPVILQWLSAIVPPRYYIDAMRKLMIMGVGIDAVLKEMLILSGMTIFLLAVALKKFKVRL